MNMNSAVSAFVGFLRCLEVSCGVSFVFSSPWFLSTFASESRRSGLGTLYDSATSEDVVVSLLSSRKRLCKVLLLVAHADDEILFAGAVSVQRTF